MNTVNWSHGKYFMLDNNKYYTNNSAEGGIVLQTSKTLAHESFDAKLSSPELQRLSSQIFWNELFSVKKTISVFSALEKSLILDQVDFSRDYLIRTKNRSSPICISIYSRTSGDNTTVVAVAFIGEYHYPAVVGITNHKLLNIYRAEHFPVPDLVRLLGSAEYCSEIMSKILSIEYHRERLSTPKDPCKLIVLGLTESIGHFIQEEMAFVNNIMYMLRAGASPSLNIAVINSFALPIGLLEDKEFKSGSNPPIFLPKRADALAMSFSTPLWIIPTSSAWITPSTDDSNIYNDLIAGYISSANYVSTANQTQLIKETPHPEEVSIVLGTRFHSRGAYSLRLRPKDIANLAIRILATMNKSVNTKLYKLCIILDFSSLDPDRNASHLGVYETECIFWHQVSQELTGINVSLEHTIDMTLIKKLEALDKAHMGVYPCGSGMCAMAHLTSTPLVDYRPSFGHSDSIEKSDKLRIRKTEKQDTCYQITYDNILFADACHDLHEFSKSEYWFKPQSIAKLFCEVVECSFDGVLHPLWPRIGIRDRRNN